MSSILALKRKLQHELQAHLRMQHQLLSQLNQVVLPAVERLHTEGGEEGAENGDGENGGGKHSGDAGETVKTEAKNESANDSNDGMTGVDDDDGDDDGDDDEDESEEGGSPNKRRKAEVESRPCGPRGLHGPP